MDLYQQEYPFPPVRPVPTHVTPFDIDEETSTEGDIEAAVIWMGRNRAGRHTHIQEEHLQQCLREAYPEETSTVLPKRAWWVKLVDIIQFMWETGSILTKLGWNVLVLIPKVNADNWEIGIL